MLSGKQRYPVVARECLECDDLSPLVFAAGARNSRQDSIPTVWPPSAHGEAVTFFRF